MSRLVFSHSSERLKASFEPYPSTFAKAMDLLSEKDEVNWGIENRPRPSRSFVIVNTNHIVIGTLPEPFKPKCGRLHDGETTNSRLISSRRTI